MAVTNLPDANSFKPNSNKYHEKERKKKDIKKAAKGNVKVKKESLGKRVASDFFQEDLSSVLEFLFIDNLIPQLKRVFLDGLYEGIGMWLGIGGRKKKSGSGTDYAGVSSGGSSYKYGSSSNSTAKSSGKVSASSAYNSLIFETRADANDVLSTCQSLAAEYDSISISDMYQVAGVSQEQWTDSKFGWNLELLRKVEIKFIPEGYTLIFPDPIPVI